MSMAPSSALRPPTPLAASGPITLYPGPPAPLMLMRPPRWCHSSPPPGRVRVTDTTPPLHLACRDDPVVPPLPPLLLYVGFSCSVRLLWPPSTQIQAPFLRILHRRWLGSALPPRVSSTAGARSLSYASPSVAAVAAFTFHHCGRDGPSLVAGPLLRLAVLRLRQPLPLASLLLWVGAGSPPSLVQVASVSVMDGSASLLSVGALPLASLAAVSSLCPMLPPPSSPTPLTLGFPREDVAVLPSALSLPHHGTILWLLPLALPSPHPACPPLLLRLLQFFLEAASLPCLSPVFAAAGYFG